MRIYFVRSARNFASRSSRGFASGESLDLFQLGLLVPEFGLEHVLQLSLASLAVSSYGARGGPNHETPEANLRASTEMNLQNSKEAKLQSSRENRVRGA